ncbi:WD40-repeat-containing domain protein [Schizophyllum amplum]|uniref:WD40-repeat-containing domain protein n=1 Tax=Schizophyllum amplum TaxID=97359 RepID=A0A550C2H5_9AGAR|nr:WD40-repeat-containing domain protein [Auriculariopsis ampla]
MSQADYVALQNPPYDGISQVVFSPKNPDQLLVSSWDTTVRLYKVGETDKESDLKSKFEHRAPVLACAFDNESTHGFSGGLDTYVRQLDLETEKITQLGAHDKTISTMSFARQSNALATGSWDRTVRLWDPRSSSTSCQTSSHQTPERVYFVDTVGNYLVAALASRLFAIYDMRKMDQPMQQRESSLKFMTRSLACMPDGTGYATASVEGRIAVEYFDPSPAAQEKKYAFKCHRQTIGDTDCVWPVNSLAFHPVHNTFASAGSDGTVSIWDHKVKKRLRQYPKFDAPVASIAFSCDGTRLAVGTSYTWDEGPDGANKYPAPWVGVRKVGDEVKPRTK